MNKFLLFTFSLFFCFQISSAQDVPRFSGNLELNANFYQEDTLIGATNIPQYDRQLYGADAWLQLNYAYKGFDVGVRFDLFNNSNLLNPNGSYTAQGIGRWYINKKINKLGISAGYLYDQIGSGIIYRAYELRPLLIDNALYGVRLTYDLTPDWKIKAFTGRQKRQFDLYDSAIRGANIDGFYAKTNEDGSFKWTIAPGFGAVARTLDDQTMNAIVNTISTYSVVEDSIGAKFNVYAFSAYNTLSVGNFSWFVEGAYKTGEAFFNPFAQRTTRSGEASPGKLVFDDGFVIYSSLSYAAKGLGISLEYKKTENFDFRVDPLESLNRGLMNFLPPMSRINTFRLPARYTPATQPLGEEAFQVDIRYKFNKKLSANLNGSYITFVGDRLVGTGARKTDELLYWEAFAETLYKINRKWQLKTGLQLINYNQDIYLSKPGKPNVETIAPYAEILYKISRKKALRTELQYMNTQEEFGSWVFGLVEFTMAPHWSFAISDMYNIDPNEDNEDAPRASDGSLKKVHYPRFDIFYAHKANRFSISYVKQVQGIVCAGGICRLEPAFSGVKVGVQSTF